MAFTIEIQHQVGLNIARPQKECFDYFCEFQTAVGNHFPGLASFSHLESNDYLWSFKAFNAAGKTIQLSFATRLIPNALDSIEITALPEKGNALMNGSWRFSGGEANTQIDFQLHLEAKVDLPFFVKGMAQSFIQKEIGNYFNTYASNISKSLSS